MNNETISNFLSQVDLFNKVEEADLKKISNHFTVKQVQAGELLLQQGTVSNSIYILKTGRMVVRVNRPEGPLTVANLESQALIGEVSFLTGKTVSADVEAMLTCEVLECSQHDFNYIQENYPALLRGLLNILANRLHSTVSSGSAAYDPVILFLDFSDLFQAKFAFSESLAKSLGQQTGLRTLLWIFRESVEKKSEKEFHHVQFSQFKNSNESLDDYYTNEIEIYKEKYDQVIIFHQKSECEEYQILKNLSNRLGVCLGENEEIPTDDTGLDDGKRRFVIQDAESPKLPYLSGSRQLIWNTKEAETAYHAGDNYPPEFSRTVSSIARHVIDLQAGIAFGGGAAWGFCHVGVLEVLLKSKLPIDVVTGCSMGSIIGTAYCTGITIERAAALIKLFSKTYWKLLEPRIWKMHLMNQSAIKQFINTHIGNTMTNRFNIPFWANAVNIQNGEAVSIRDASLVDTVIASISLPGILPPFNLGNKFLVDAGIMDSVPVDMLKDMGARYALGINVMQPVKASVGKKGRKKSMQTFDVFCRCFQVSGHEIGKNRSQATADYTLQPILPDSTMLDFGKGVTFIEKGKEEAEKYIEGIDKSYQRLKDMVLAPARARCS